MKLADRYLDLVKSALVNELYVELEAQLLFSVLCASEHVLMQLPDFWSARKHSDLLEQLKASKQNGDRIIVETGHRLGDPGEDSSLGRYTHFAHTSAGRRRLDHLHECMTRMLKDDIPGDLVDAGPRLGGCAVLMRAVLAAYDCEDRKIWLMNALLENQPQDQEIDWTSDVRENLSRFGLLDDQIGWLPEGVEQSSQSLSEQSIALLRIGFDQEQAVSRVLDDLYDNVSAGGWVMVDCYGSSSSCKRAVDRFREQAEIVEPVTAIDDQAVSWRVS